MAERLDRFPIELGTVPVYLGDATQLLLARVLDDMEQPVDLNDGWSDWTASWRVYANSDDSLSLPISVVVETVSVRLTGDLTRQMKGRCGVFDVQATSTSGEVLTWFRGSTDPEMDVTR